MTYRLIHGDCLEVMRGMADSSVDSVVTDPPAGISFMGKGWDADKGGRDAWIAWLSSVMAECLRVVKPGGHALVWALPRTSHWTATAIEDAGWEIRDVITHHFGSGFPKSLDVSKAIDKMAGAEREVVGKSARHVSGKPEQRTVGLTGTSTFAETVGMGMYLTAPATPEAAKWEGWGTALKPSTEHWILARRPLVGTVAANVLAWSTGALNVDGCRVGTEGGGTHSKSAEAAKGNGIFGAFGAVETSDALIGRWPPNLLLTHSASCNGECSPDCPVRALDGQSGVTVSSNHIRHNTPEGVNKPHSYGRSQEQWTTTSPADTGGASRFYPTFSWEPEYDVPFLYQAKASRAERGEGNSHPTVKSLALMRWLARLVTPPGGVLLDPFAGSGTTGVAAIQEGFEAILVEREAEYHAIAEARLEHEASQPRQMSMELTA